MFDDELRIASDAVREAGGEVARLRREGLRYGRKDGWELVSEADLHAAELLHDRLLNAFPSDGWLNEEHRDTADRLGCDRTWIVDPIDGTREYLQGIPEYAISVGLSFCGAPVLGVVYNPATEEFFAARVDGASEKTPSALWKPRYDVLVGRGEHSWDELPPLPSGARVHGVGSVAYRLALLSAGKKGDAVLTGYGRMEWDVAAGVALCLAAGLRVTDVLGEPLAFNKPSPHIRGLVVAEPGLHNRIVQHIDQW
ncbi:MAG TPA: 3'(2'),5'-bisphosphate nucleotidase CysQ [Tepidiformaceae bacterium]|nr:3'(2'),5'-bisphosphate nucleotidase CysQ [Tepidiformaceae bacterium]